MNSEPSLKAWSTFIKKNKTNVPEGLNDKLWESFQNKKRKRRRTFIGALSAAASVLLLISFFIGGRVQKEQSYAEKEMLLNQALDMFKDSEQKKAEYKIFYENEMIVVYTITE